MSLTVELAKKVVATNYGNLPDEAIDWARVGLIDYTGVTLAGSTEPSGKIVGAAIEAAEQPGPSLIFGGNARTTALNAALINGTAAHAQDFDDCSNTIGGHPSAPILPAAIALGEKLGTSGRDLILAYVLGFEVETSIARGVHFYHYEKGWHPTATLGVFGSTAACAKLLGLDADKTATALAIAVSLSSGVKANFGTMVKPLHVGHCSRHGLFAALLAKEGFTANQGAFEHKQGFFEVFNGKGNYWPEKIFSKWAAPFDIVYPAIAIKQYPCCGSTHPAVDAMINLVDREGLTPEMVKHVDSWTHPRRLAHTNRPDPQSPLDAKFSVQYCVARALMHGKVVMQHFDDTAYRDKDVRALMQRVEAAPHPEMLDGSDAKYLGAEIRVELKDGRVLREWVDRARGRGADAPLTADKLKVKFESCAAMALPADRIAALYAALEHFESLTSMRQFTDLVATRPDAATAAAE
jgi:2-methylcitrate dehydratase PrpD